MGAGRFWWSEFCTHNPERAMAFYTLVFGWAFTPSPERPGALWLIEHDGMLVGSLFNLDGVAPGEVADHWLTYFESDDVDTSVAAVVAAGGRVLRAPFDVPNGCRIAIVLDAGGGCFGLGQKAQA